LAKIAKNRQNTGKTPFLGVFGLFGPFRALSGPRDTVPGGGFTSTPRAGALRLGAGEETPIGVWRVPLHSFRRRVGPLWRMSRDKPEAGQLKRVSLPPGPTNG